MLVLDEAEVTERLGLSDAVHWVERSFACLGSGMASVAPRRRIEFSAGRMHDLAASLECEQLVGAKLYTTIMTDEGERRASCLVAFDTQTGRRVAVIESYRLSLVRTAATTALAVRYLAPRDATVLSIVGTGSTALLQLRCVLAERGFERVLVYGRSEARRVGLAEAVTEELGVPAVAADTARAAVDAADVLITATDSSVPVLMADWVGAQTLVCAIGSNYPHKRELPPDLFPRASAVYVDSRDAAQTEAGDLILAAEEGRLNWNDVREFGDLVAAGNPVEPQGGPVIFKSVGIATQDLAMVAFLLSQAGHSNA